MDRKEVLETAIQCVCKDREEQYGKPDDNFCVVSDFWTIYLSAIGSPGVIIRSDDVAIMMALFKLARIATGNSADSFVDLAGYAALAGELASNWIRGQTDGN